MTAALVLAPTAGALREVSQSESVAPGAGKTITATCPSGQAPYSGGFEAPGFDATGPGPRIFPLGSLIHETDGWQSTVVNTGEGAGVASAYAYCGGHPSRISTFERTRRVDPGEIDFINVRCRDAGYAVAGGFLSLNGAVPVASIRARNHSWRAYGYNQTGTRQRLTAAVVCDSSEPALIERRQRSTPAGTNPTGTALAVCHPGEEAVSGGFYGNWGAASGTGWLVYTSRRSGRDAWEVSAASLGAASTFTVYVYCAG